MVSKLREMADRDKAMFKDELGDTATLTPFGGEPAEIVMIVAEIDGAGRQGADGNLIDHRRTWLIDRDDLPDPKPYVDTVTYEGKKYTLDNFRNEGSWFRCEFTRTESTKRVGAETYRDKT